jgi:hypothetical protein
MVRTMRMHRPCSRSIPTAVAFTAFVASALLPDPAGASCASRTAKQYVDQADLVFLGRAGPIKVKGKRSYQPISVLQVLKGKPGKVFTRVRMANVAMPNDRVYKAGEVALFFVNKGEVDLCSGNFPIGAQMERMAEYLELGRGRAGALTVAMVQRVVTELLVPYLHDRPRVPITYRPLAGKSFNRGKSALFFVKSRRKDAVEITRAVSRGRAHLIEGFYHLEGFGFRALLLSGAGKRRSKIEVLHKSGWERRSR